MKGYCVNRREMYQVPLLDDGGNEIEACRLDVGQCVSVPQFASHYLGKNGCLMGCMNSMANCVIISHGVW